MAKNKAMSQRGLKYVATSLAHIAQFEVNGYTTFYNQIPYTEIMQVWRGCPTHTPKVDVTQSNAFKQGIMEGEIRNRHIMDIRSQLMRDSARRAARLCVRDSQIRQVGFGNVLLRIYIGKIDERVSVSIEPLDDTFRSVHQAYVTKARKRFHNLNTNVHFESLALQVKTINDPMTGRLWIEADV